MKILIVVIAIIAVLGAAVWGYMLFNKKAEVVVVNNATPSPAPVTSVVPKVTPVVVPKATAKVDDLVNALLSDSTNEGTSVEADSGESAVLESDSQLITNFGQSYEDEF